MAEMRAPDAVADFKPYVPDQARVAEFHARRRWLPARSSA